MSGIYVGRNTARLVTLDSLLILGVFLISAAGAGLGDGTTLLNVVAQEWKGALVLTITVHLVAFYVFELYNLELDFRRVPNLLRVVGAVVNAALVMAVASFVIPRWGLGRRIFGLHAVLVVVAVAALRALGSSRWAKFAPVDRAIVVTTGAVSEEILGALADNPERMFALVGTVRVGASQRPTAPDALEAAPKSPLRASTPPPLGTVRDSESALKKHDAHHLIVAGIDSLPPDAAGEILRLKSNGVQVHELISIFERLTGRIPLELVNDLYFLRVPAFTRDTEPMLSNLFRILDVIVALGLMVLSAPLWVFAALGIKATMPGPVFYSQERVGKDESTYIIHKFRSMRIDAEKDGPKWSQRGDDRVTPFGRFLRRTRIDELPQLWNVLRGDMSLVGPRPERPVFVEVLKKEIPYYALRFQLKPGLTGWAQVNYRYGSTVDDTRVKLSFDLYYIQERSLGLFALILLKTVQTVLFKPGS